MVDLPEIGGPRISDERLLEIIRKKAFRYEEAFMFVGTCRDMKERIAELEAQLAEKEAENERLRNNLADRGRAISDKERLISELKSEAAAADQIIAQIEERFPNWRSYRDLLDCIDVTLYDLRRYAR